MKSIAAFPMDFGNDGLQEGMTLRDWYAGQALNVIIPRPKTIEEFEEIIDSGIAFSKAAYQIADAMIKTREDSNVSEKT